MVDMNYSNLATVIFSNSSGQSPYFLKDSTIRSRLCIYLGWILDLLGTKIRSASSQYHFERPGPEEKLIVFKKSIIDFNLC